jgi:hypothetical protein
MNSQSGKLFVAVLSLQFAAFAGASAAQEGNRKAGDDSPDLVITEDSQLAPQGRMGKAVIGSCEQDKPLWEGKIAIKNIGRGLVKAKETRLEFDKPFYVVRAYIPNNIQLMDQKPLKNDLSEFGQELVRLSIGEGEPKCRNYNAPPVFDEHLSGRPGPIYAGGEGGPPPPPPGPGPSPEDKYGWRVKRLQHALIEKGYSLPADGRGSARRARHWSRWTAAAAR